jgi:hypothetical protein
MKNGKIYFPINAPFIEEVEDEVFSWIGLPSETDDIVDNLSDAANELGSVSDTLKNVTDVSKLKSNFTFDNVQYLLRQASQGQFRQLKIGSRKIHPLRKKY